MTLPESVRQGLRALLFDLDGTLLDSLAAHYRAYEVTLAHFDIELTPEMFRETYSPDWYATYDALGIPAAQWEEADTYWLAEARNHQPALFSGARPLLADLAHKYQLGLVTSGSRERVMRDLANTGIGDYFAVIVTGNDISDPKPAPEGLLMALEQLQLRPDEALFVGDSWEDCQMARTAGVPFIGIATEFATVSGMAECVQLANLADLAGYITLDRSS